jgi:Zinc carboxypeptidase/Cytosolic carboxypeptidase N-terminal domain
MKLKIIFKILSIFFIITSFITCSLEDFEPKEIQFYSQFESASIGPVEQIANNEWTMALRDDNNDESLPDRWRNWWYLQITHIPTNTPIVLNLTNRGWPYYYVPVYSYDNKTWFHFEEHEVSQPEGNTLRMEKQFQSSTIWLARFYPYTFSQLIAYMLQIDASPFVKGEIIGQSSYNRPIHMLTITDFNRSNNEKKQIWLHARSHPAETGSSFLLEGLINFLISDTPDARDALSNLIFHIVPMHNVDGVVNGNYRSTPDSLNLEVMWFFDHEGSNPFELAPNTPSEIQVLHRTISSLINSGPPFTIALNLHSSNSEPDTATFFYPHFGPESLGYTNSEETLWLNQVDFIRYIGAYFGTGLIEPLPSQGGASFVSKTYPESWWWANFQDSVMALTLETVYSRAGFRTKWITPDDLRNLGKAVGLAIMAYHNIPSDQPRHMMELRSLFNRYNSHYPELYPPAAKDENKE